MKISITIPAYNEETRIERTIRAYHQFFSEKNKETNLLFELIIVLNGCKDNTLSIVEQLQQELGSESIHYINLQQAGKGIAIKAGFADALNRDNDFIGFVDADMATSPQAFYDLFKAINHSNYDGIIASRYMPGAQITPARPVYKRYGSRIIYEPYVWALFGLRFHDYQCGAKLFKKDTIAAITPQLTVAQWAFDVELLYLSKKAGFAVQEIPTVWHDQADSKLTLRGGLKMFSALFKVWKQHRKQ